MSEQPCRDRRGDVATIMRRLERRRRLVTQDQAERAYDREVAAVAARTRVVHRRRLPLIRAESWAVEQRGWFGWRVQGLHGSRDPFHTVELARWFRDLCVRVDARDRAEASLLQNAAHT